MHPKNSNEEILYFFVYIPPYHANKSNNWQELVHFLSNTDVPWCLMGDLNDITHPSEKLGGL